LSHLVPRSSAVHIHITVFAFPELQINRARVFYLPCLLLQVYIQTAKGVLIDVNPQIRIPRTFKRFGGLMGKLPFLTLAQQTKERKKEKTFQCLYLRNFPFLLTDPPHTHTVIRVPLVQLLYKLSIRSANGSEKLMKVIKNPVTDHLPVGCRKIGKFYQLRQYS
jgi:rRNA small subunit pseudouridine methyltransferase Nep1